MTETTTDTLLTSSEVAEHLRVGERYVRRLVAERRLAHVKIGAKVRFCPADIDRFVADARREAQTDELLGIDAPEDIVGVEATEPRNDGTR